jgi:hypothetical protein
MLQPVYDWPKKVVANPLATRRREELAGVTPSRFRAAGYNVVSPAPKQVKQSSYSEVADEDVRKELANIDSLIQNELKVAQHPREKSPMPSLTSQNKIYQT